MISLRRCRSSSTFSGRKYQSLTVACESLKENPPECITVEEIESVQKSLQVDKLQNKKRYVFGEKESKKLLNSHQNMAMQPQLGNSRKSYWPLLKGLSDLGSSDTGKLERKEESNQRNYSKDRSNTRQTLVIGYRAQFEATDDDHIPKNGRGRDKPKCSQGSSNWFIAALSWNVWQMC